MFSISYYQYLLLGVLFVSFTSCKKQILPWEVNGLLHYDNIQDINEFFIKETESNYYHAEFHSFIPKEPQSFPDLLTEKGWVIPGKDEMRIFWKLIPKELKSDFSSMHMIYKEIDGRRCFILHDNGFNNFYCVVAFPKY